MTGTTGTISVLSPSRKQEGHQSGGASGQTRKGNSEEPVNRGIAGMAVLAGGGLRVVDCEAEHAMADAHAWQVAVAKQPPPQSC